MFQYIEIPTNIFFFFVIQTFISLLVRCSQLEEGTSPLPQHDNKVIIIITIIII